MHNKYNEVVVLKLKNMEKLLLSPVSRAHRRDCESRTLLATKIKIHTFKGESIEGVCVSELSSSEKAGKWSTEEYSVVLAEGVEVINLIQDWETGRYINDISSVKSMAKELNLENYAPSVVAEYIKNELPKTWQRHLDFKEKLTALDDADVKNTIEIQYHYEFRNNRCGHLHLLLDGEIWEQKDIEGKVVIKEQNHYSGRGGGGCRYKLIIDANMKVEELYESDYGEDALDTRGFIYDDKKGWIKNGNSGNTRNTPFADLLKNFDKSLND